MCKCLLEIPLGNRDGKRRGASKLGDMFPDESLIKMGKRSKSKYLA